MPLERATRPVAVPLPFFAIPMPFRMEGLLDLNFGPLARSGVFRLRFRSFVQTISVVQEFLFL